MKPTHPQPSAAGVTKPGGEPQATADFLKAVSLDPHYVPSRLPTGKVVGVWGQAVMRKPDGTLHVLQVGDEVHKGDVILTSQDGIVQIEGEHGARPAAVAEADPAPTTQQQDFDQLDPTGAGLGGGGSGGLQAGLRVDRIALETNPSEYAFAFQQTGLSPITGSTLGAAGTVGTAAATGTTTAPTFSVSSPSVGEGDGFAQFSVNLSGASNAAITLHLGLHSGTATAGQDFAPSIDISLDGGRTWTAGADLTLPAGQTSALVRVPVLQDTAVEGNETFTLDVTRSGGATSNIGATGTSTIVDDDTPGSSQPPTVTHVEPGAPGIADDNVIEGQNLVYTVTLSNASDSPTHLAYSLGGTATPGVDYGTPTFSGGVTLVNGELVVPAGVTSFTVTLPTIDDALVEAPRETAVLTIGGLSAEGGILDNDTPTVTHIEPGAPSAAGDDVAEGQNLGYTVTLSNPSDSATHFAYSLGGTATPGTDYGTPAFSNGVTLVNGELIVPAGVTSFTVTLPTVDDTVQEAPRETAVLTIGGVSAEGGILDNDGPPTVTHIEPGAPGITDDNVTEGQNLVYTVTLSNASDNPTHFAYSLSGTATPGADYGTPTFSNGVTLVNGELIVPAGVTSFTVTLPTIDDAITEAPREPAVLSVGGVTAEGGILDNDGPPTVAHIEPGAPAAAGDDVTEGHNLVYTVTLSNPSDSATHFAYSLGGTATPGADYGTPTFSNGVTLINGELIVPAGVTSFTVTLPTIDDAITEAPRETAVLTVGGVTAAGGILDNDGPPTVTHIEPGAPGAAGDDVIEGQNLVYTVTLSNPSDSTTHFAYSLGGTATPGADYGTPTFSNGVTLVNGELIVPAGVTSFTVTLPTIDDAITEAPRETAVLTVGGVTAEGGVLDNDGPPTVTHIEPGAPGAAGDDVTEGQNLVYTVTLSNPSDSATHFAYSLGGTATPGADYGTPTFSNGVTLVNGELLVPAGVTSFTVTLPTIDDTVQEAPRETAVLTIGGVAAEGGILDNDGPPTVTHIERGAPGATGDDVIEGQNLVYTVTLSNASDSPTHFAYSLGGTATAGADYGTPTFSNGVTLINGELIVPAGVTSFTVTLPTVDDAITEAPRETAVLTVGGVTAEGGVLDNDAPPTVTHIEPGAPGAAGDDVTEGQNLVYTVTLSNPSDSATHFAYSLGGTATPGADYGTPTFSSGVTLINGELIVPAGVTSFTVTLPTIDDTITEAPRETAVLTVGGVTTEGGIRDNDGPPTITHIEPGAPGAAGDDVTEGQNLVYTVTLSNPSDSATHFAYSLGGTATPGADYGTPTFSNGVTLINGELIVPAGVTSFTVTLPTVDDAITEAPRETAVLTVGGVTAEGGILDNDGPPTVTHIEPGAPAAAGDDVTEGQNLVYTVTLSNASDSATHFAYSLGGTATPGADYGTPTFSSGVTLVNGELIVPAGVTSFTVTLPTIDDTMQEAPRETAVLTIGGVTVEGGILDNEGPPTVTQIEPGAPGAAGDDVTEGQNLVYTVTLSNPSDSATHFAYSLGGTATPGADYGTPTFSSGVTLINGELIVPAGVTSFTVTLPTIDDTITEAPRETAVLTVGGVTAEGGILDNDGPPTVTHIEPGAPGIADDNVVEGQNLVYTVTLSNASDSPTHFAYSLGGTATPGADYSTPTFSNGVTLVNGELIVPAGVTSFTVTIPTIDDTITEAPRETAVLTIGGITAEGGILDNDGPPTVTHIEPGAPGAAGDDVTEGQNLVYTVTLSNASDSPTHLAYSLSGTATPSADYSTPTFSSGVTLVNGELIVPAGVTSFTVTLPTIDDTITEAPRETAVLTIGGITAEGGILDNDGPPTVTHIEPGAPGAAGDDVTEGQNLVYTVTLSNASDSPTHFAYSLGGTATPGTDYGTPTFSNGVTLGNGELIVPAGVTSFTVTLPTIDDAITEAPRETAVLSVGGVTAEGGILDNDGPPTVTHIEPGTPAAAGDDVTEGHNLVYTVTLSNASDSPTHFAYSLGGTATPGADYGTPTFSNGVTLVNGELIVPAGVASFTVTLPTIDDTITEAPRETAVLTIGGITAEGGILDNDGPPTVTHIEPGAPGAAGDDVTEGQNLVYTVTLSNASDSPTHFAYSLGGTATPGADYSPPTFSSGVTLVNGELIVPAGVTSFTVTLPTIDDAITEAPRETAMLTVGGVTAEGGILDNDTPPAGCNVTVSTQEDQPLTLTLANFPMDDAEQGQQQAPSAVRVDALPALGLLTLAGQAVHAGDVISAADITAGRLVYTPAADGNNNGNGTGYASFQFSVADAGGLFDLTPNTATIDVLAVNDAPVHQVPGAQTFAEDTPLVFCSANGNALRIGDVDAGNANLTMTLSVTHGTLALGGTAGLASVSGNGTGTVTFTGTLQALNQALEGTRFTPDAHYNGTAQLTLHTDDLGNTGSGGTLSDHDVVQLHITPVNDLPTIGSAAQVTLSEEALPHGLGADSSDATVRTGTLAIADVDGDPLTLGLVAPTQALTSGGQPVQWTGSGTPNDPLVGSVTDACGCTQTVLQASISWVNGQAQYTVSLLAPVDHLDGTQPVDALTLSFGVKVDDGHGTPVIAPALQVTLEDDTPAALAPQQVTVHTEDTNLLLVLDTSGSMAEKDGNASGATRLEMAVGAMIKLLQGYENAGNVMVTLVNFSDSGRIALPWMTATNAITWLQDPSHLTANGATNYDDALAKAQAAYGADGRMASAENVAYFFSDGQPNRPTKSAGINATEQAAWETFLKANDIDSYAIGLGHDVPASALNPIAYDGRNENDPSGHTMVVNDLSQLDSVLASTIPAPITGHLTTGTIALEDAVGADGGFVRSVQVGSVTYTYDPHDSAHPISGAPDGSYTFAGGVLTMGLANGSLAVDVEHGGYTFRPNVDGNGQFSETVQYSLSDADGDIVSSTLTFNGQHTVYGGDGANVLQGTSGADLIIGGAGNDVMTGGLGSDVFAWHFADRGTHAAPARDVITDFNIAPASQGGDVLDLRDLLQGESANAASLDRYLDFTVSGGTTTVHVASGGAPTANATAAEDQSIVLTGVNLGSLGSNDTAIIQHLLDQGKLLVDQNGS